MTIQKPTPMHRGPAPRQRLEDEFERLELHRDSDICRHFRINSRQLLKIRCGGPDALTFAMLLAEHGMDVTYWLTGNRASSVDLSPAELAVVENYRAADDAGQKALRRVGSALAQSISEAADGTRDG